MRIPIPTIQQTLTEETPKITVPEIREKYEFLTKLSKITRFHSVWDDLLKIDLDPILEEIMREALESDEPEPEA